jgi:carbonic anhydrase/acetyltransferase-like protein (isoleucine patch superfamily)
VRVAIVGAGGYGRVALDVLLAGGLGDRVLGFYDDAHAALSGEVRGVPILGDVSSLGARFLTSVHPEAYVSAAAVVGDGCVAAAGAIVHPDAELGSHCFLGPQSVVDRDAEVGAGTWISAGCVVGPGARVGARVVLGQNSSVGRKAVVDSDVEVGALRHVGREGG